MSTAEDIKEIETNPTPFLVRLEAGVWRCGDLGTGAIAIGLTTLVSSILLPVYYVEMELRDRSFSFEIVVVLLVALFLVIADCALILGATKRYTWLLVPWIAIHLLVEVSLVFYLAFKYSVLDGHRVVIVISFFVMLYFIAVVGLFYLQLKRQEKEKVLNESAVSNEAAQVMVEMGSNEDDTFTGIAERSGDRSTTTTNRGNLYVSLIGSPENPTLDDSGEFAVPSSNNDKFPLNESFLKPLPTPDEVIQLKGQSVSEPEPQVSRPKAKKEVEVVNMDLVDAFTPFKRKPSKHFNEEDSVPKMKIFLPKADDGSEASSVSSTEPAL